MFFLEFGCWEGFEGQLRSSQLLLVKVQLMLSGGSNFYFVHQCDPPDVFFPGSSILGL